MSDRAIWQIAGGPISRSYKDVFLKYGVGLIGPGDAGPWSSDRSDDEFGGSSVRSFASDVKIGDIFLLRVGVSKIYAIGVVASDYFHCNSFDDVNGWDLQQTRRVRWFELPNEFDFGKAVFGANPRRFSGVATLEVVDYARRFMSSAPDYWQSANLPELPKEDPSLESIPDELCEIVSTAKDLTSMYWETESFGDFPSEDEMIVHFVVPFLRALGWRPEQIAIKWRNIDVAVFRCLPRTPENCHLVIEVKRLGEGVEGALDQAKGYVESLGVPRDIVVSDGIRYRLYGADKKHSSVGYANLCRLKEPSLKMFNRLRRP
jgi:hypothetical protein